MGLNGMMKIVLENTDNLQHFDPASGASDATKSKSLSAKLKTKMGELNPFSSKNKKRKRVVQRRALPPDLLHG